MAKPKQTGLGRQLLNTLGVTALGAALLTASPVVFNALEPVVGEVSIAKAQAQDSKSKPKQKTRKTPAIRPATFKKIEKAQLALEEKRYSDAQVVLDDLLSTGGKRGLNGYERAMVYNYKANIYLTQENAGKALEALRQVIADPNSIPPAMELSTKYTIAQLYFAQEKWNEGIRQIRQWMDTKRSLEENIPANAYALLARGYYQNNQYSKALREIETAIKIYKDKGKVPKKEWYALQRFFYHTKKEYRKVVSILNESMRYYTSKQDWNALAGAMYEQEKEIETLAAFQALADQKLLTRGPELMNLAALYLNNDAPYSAYKVMYGGFKRKQIKQTSRNLELLGNSLRQAQHGDKAIPYLQKAAKLSDDGEIWAQLANVFVDKEDYKRAARAAELSLKKGGLKKPGFAHLTLGQARFNLKDYEGAREAFVEAGKRENTEKYAEQWIQYMDKEIARQKGLQS